MRTSSGEGFNWISQVAHHFSMATHMKNYRKIGEIIRKIGHLERKLGKVLGNKGKE